MRDFITRNNHIMIHGEEVVYQTRCRDFEVHDRNGKAMGTIFSYEFMRTNVEETSKRPVLFAYNGGPGASCIFILTGAFTPKRVYTGESVLELERGEVPVRLEDNPHSLLDICDLVLMDPVGAGYGQLYDNETDSEFFNDEADAEAAAEFFEYWISEYDRWDSPKYLLGESYGTIRSSLLVNCLAGDPIFPERKGRRIFIDGIVHMGSAIISEPTFLVFSEKGLPKCAQTLPTIAAAHWYHSAEKPCSAEERVKEAYDFVEKEYLRALYLGSRVSDAERKALSRRLEYFTGIPAAYFETHQLQIDTESFLTIRRASEHLVIGTYDGRFTIGAESESTPENPIGGEAAMARLSPLFRKGFYEYEKVLGIELKARTYTGINFEINGKWEYRSPYTPFAHLQAALKRDPKLRILFVNGIYDFQSEIGQASYAAAKFEAEEGQVMVREYPAGHMPYVGEESSQMLERDLRAFLK